MAAATPPPPRPPPSNAPITNTVRIQPMSGRLTAIVASPYLSPVGRTSGGDVGNDQAASDDQNVTIARVVMPEPIAHSPSLRAVVVASASNLTAVATWMDSLWEAGAPLIPDISSLPFVSW